MSHDGIDARQEHDEHADLEDDELDLGNPVAELRQPVVGMAALKHTISFPAERDYVYGEAVLPNLLIAPTGGLASEQIGFPRLSHVGSPAR